MQNYCKTIGALAAASALVAGNALAEVEYELHTGYSSEYIFRGLDLGDSLIEVGANVATEWNGIGWTAGAWYGSFDGPSNGARFAPTPGAPFGTAIDSLDTDELDLFTEFSKDFGFVTASVGYIAYLYPQSQGSKDINNLDDVQEVSFGLSRDLGFCEVSYNYYLAVEGDNYGYMELDFSRSFELNSCVSLNLDTNFGYLGDEGMFSAWTSRVSLDWGFAGQAKFSPFVAVAVGLADSDADNAYASAGNEVSCGAMLSVGF
jgi:hypothetical protein